MGVPGFSSWFARTACPQAFQEHTGKRFDHVFIDVASLLHTVMRHAKSASHLHRLLYGALDDILFRYQPRKSVLIAVDGPAPLAKLLTQRGRRLSQGRREARGGGGGGGGGRGRGQGLSALGLTPGTPLMLDLERGLAFYVAQRLQASWAHLHFELSGARVPGEGEMKLLSRLQRPAIPAAPGDQFAVVGGDSDLVIMALLGGAGDLWVVPEGGGGRRRPAAARSFSLRALERCWAQLPLVRGAGSSAATAARVAALRADLAALSVLGSGNDYLPGLLGAALESSAAGRGLWEVYLALRSADAWRDRQLVLRDGPAPRLDAEVLAAVLERQQLNSRMAARRDGWARRKPPPDAAAYLAGVEWVLGMYSSGACADFRYVYDAQAPSATELLEHLAERGARAAEHAAAARGPLLPAVCALALLPREQGREQAPAALRALMDPGSPIAALYAVCDECEARAAAAKAAAAALAVALQQRAALAALAAAEPAADEAEQAAAEGEVCARRADAREASSARLQHLLAAHPHSPFPIADIEAAVAAVPSADIPPAEQPLLAFDTARAYWRTTGRACCCAACRRGGEAGECEYAVRQAPPPAPGMRPVSVEGLRCLPLLEAAEPAAASAGGGDATVHGCRCPACWGRSAAAAAAQPLVVQRQAGSARRRSRSGPARQHPQAASACGLHHACSAAAALPAPRAPAVGGLGRALHTCLVRPIGLQGRRLTHGCGAWRCGQPAWAHSAGPWRPASRMLRLGRQALSVVHALPRF